MLEPGPVVEHRQGPVGRVLHQRRVAIAVAIAAAEGLLILVDEISVALALIVAIAVVVGYFTLGDRLRPGRARQVAWIAAVSQTLVMLVPVLLIVIGTLAIVGIAVLAIAALVLLFSRRG